MNWALSKSSIEKFETAHWVEVVFNMLDIVIAKLCDSSTAVFF